MGDTVDTSSCAIAVMAKASIAGKAKTRLAPLVSSAEAANLNTSFLRDIADNLLAARAYANITGVMAYAPAGSADFFRSILPEGLELLETVAPTFGECLFSAASRLLGRGHGAVCLLNSDSPTLPAAYLIAAATALAAPGDRIVLGPSTDGGYYLLGLKAPHRHLFANIDWSTERVAQQTLARAEDLGLDVHLLPSWYDVDDADAFRILAGELLEGRRFRVCGHRPTPAHWTRCELERLFADADLAGRLGLAPAASLVA